MRLEVIYAVQYRRLDLDISIQPQSLMFYSEIVSRHPLAVHFFTTRTELAIRTKNSPATFLAECAQNRAGVTTEALHWGQPMILLDHHDLTLKQHRAVNHGLKSVS